MQSPVVRKLVVALVLIAGVVYFVLVRDTEIGSGLEWVDLGQQRAVDRAPETREFDGEQLLERSEPFPAEPARAGDSIAGRAVQLDGAPIAALGVERRHPTLVAAGATTDADGGFAIELDELRGELHPTTTEWMVLGGHWRLEPDRRDGYLLILARSVHWVGTVVDHRRRPIADAVLHVLAPSDLLVPFDLASPPIDHPTQRGWSDQDGRFDLGPAPGVAGMRIEVTRAGFKPSTTLLPAHPEGGVVLELEPLD